MDLEGKRQILLDADFSEKKMIPMGKSGFGQLVAGVGISLDFLTRPFKENTVKKYLEEGAIACYQTLIGYYSTIPFDKMDPTDEDFAYLFNFRDRLVELGVYINAFADRIRQNNTPVPRTSDEYIKARAITNELYHLMKQFRGRILASI